MSSDIERLIYHIQSVASEAANEWAKGFALSKVRHSRRHRWKPSTKQIEVMSRLVAELFAEKQEGEIVVIE